jgi:hypothetical protein
MALARSARVSPVVTPEPVLKVTDLPEAGINVMDDVGRAAVGLLSRLEYHDPVLARLLTTTVWVPVAVPVTAVALRSLVFEDDTVLAASGPDRELRDCISVAIASVAVSIAVSAVVWLVSVVWSASQTLSGALSA